MENFKYRIWDIPNKHWVESPYFINQNGYLCGLNQYGDLQVKNVNIENFKIILYTRKKDSNRNPIYEGHIIKDDSSLYVVRFGEYQANDNQSYSNEIAYGFYIEYINHKNIIDHATRIQYGIIVGHELENPELIL